MWPVLNEGAKRDLEEFFISSAFCHELGRIRADQKRIWADQRTPDYDSWHRKQATKLAGSIGSHVGSRYCADAAAAKLLNTFMHQLMKYEWSRFLWEDLHLPLDRGTFPALRRLAREVGSEALREGETSEILRQNPYTISLEKHELVQKQLWRLSGELNRRREREFKLTSRIELNLLWAGGGDD